MSISNNFTEFRDFNISFEPHPITGDLILSKGKKSVAQSIIVILSTYLGERIIEKDVGTTLRRLLFDNPIDIAIIELRNEINRAILENEPRVRYVNVDVSVAPDQKNYEVSIEYIDTEININENNDLSDVETLNFFLPIS